MMPCTKKEMNPKGSYYENDDYVTRQEFDNFVNNYVRRSSYERIGGNAGGIADYIVYKQGSIYKAKNGLDGGRFSQNTDFTTVMQACIDDSSDRKSIFIKPGIYSVASVITPRAYLTINGGGINHTYLGLASGADCDMFGDTSTPGADINYFNLNHMTLNGNKGNNSTGNGINLTTGGSYGYSNDQLTYLSIISFPGYGIIHNNVHTLNFNNSYIESCDKGGICVSGAYFFCHNNTINHNGWVGINCADSIEAGTWGLLYAWITACQVSDNGNDESGKESGIHIGGKSVIMGCDIQQNDRFGISVIGDDIAIIGNIIHGNAVQVNAINFSSKRVKFFGNHVVGHANDYTFRNEEVSIDGYSEESANAEEPQYAGHQEGAIVKFTDSGDASGDGIYIKDNAGNWVKLA